MRRELVLERTLVSNTSLTLAKGRTDGADTTYYGVPMDVVVNERGSEIGYCIGEYPVVVAGREMFSVSVGIRDGAAIQEPVLVLVFSKPAAALWQAAMVEDRHLEGMMDLYYQYVDGLMEVAI